MKDYAQKQRDYRFLIKENLLKYNPPKDESEYVHVFSIIGIAMYIISLIVYK